MRPKIPADLSTLSIDELVALRAEIRTYGLGVLSNPERTAADSADVAVLMQSRDEIKVVLDAKRAEVAAETARLAADDAAKAALEGDDEPPVVEVDVTVPVPVADPDDDPEDPPADPEASGKGTKPIVQTSTGLASQPEKPKMQGRIVPSYLKAAAGVAGKTANEGFESWAELALACVAKSENLGAESDKQVVGRIRAEYPKDRQLSDGDFELNMSRFEPDEIQAALCAPATPYYGLACMNTTRRPVFASLPQFQAPRGKVTVMSSPALSDITTGVGLWTATDDADAAAVKETCQTITCNDPSTYTISGVYRCMTIKNLLAMTYPELVEAWLNRLAAAQARLAEQQLLAAMYTGTTELNVEKLGYGAATTITTAIMRYLALYQETQRWDIEGNLEAWLPRWVKTGIKIDMARRRNTSGQFNGLMSDSQVDAMLREAGVNPHWFIDTPSYATAIPAVGTVNLADLPTQVQILIAPSGKFALMDRGELTIGVRGDNLYRDNESNSRNQFTFFFENFEGVVNTTSCPAHTLDVPVCWNGVQMDDNLLDCLGHDVATYQS